jgi:hypothetical protein
MAEGMDDPPGYQMPNMVFPQPAYIPEPPLFFNPPRPDRKVAEERANLQRKPRPEEVGARGRAGFGLPTPPPPPPRDWGGLPGFDDNYLPPDVETELDRARRQVAKDQFASMVAAKKAELDAERARKIEALQAVMRRKPIDSDEKRQLEKPIAFLKEDVFDRVGDLQQRRAAYVQALRKSKPFQNRFGVWLWRDPFPMGGVQNITWQELTEKIQNADDDINWLIAEYNVRLERMQMREQRAERSQLAKQLAESFTSGTLPRPPTPTPTPPRPANLGEVTNNFVAPKKKGLLGLNFFGLGGSTRHPSSLPTRRAVHSSYGGRRHYTRRLQA